MNGDRDRDRDRGDRSLSPSNEEAMYEAYGVPPFTSDMPPPPPLLMPVPGAGLVSLSSHSNPMHFIYSLHIFISLEFFFYRPLGPFVPAPPEVAMQMLREQGGGGASYDPSGRKMRSGPHMGGGPGPIIAVPPSFRPDPRQMRR